MDALDVGFNLAHLHAGHRLHHDALRLDGRRRCDARHSHGTVPIAVASPVARICRWDRKYGRDCEESKSRRIQAGQECECRRYEAVCTASAALGHDCMEDVSRTSMDRRGNGGYLDNAKYYIQRDVDMPLEKHDPMCNTTSC